MAYSENKIKKSCVGSRRMGRIIKGSMMLLLCMWSVRGIYEIRCTMHLNDVTLTTVEVVAEVQEEKKKIALTFDDGPSKIEGGTEYLLDGLLERDVKVTFFLLGKSASNYPEIVSRIYEEGHLIGCHSYSHIDLTTISENEFMIEIEMTNQAIYDCTGESVLFIRPPFGEWERSLETMTTMIPVFWSIDSLDWTTDNVEQIVENVVTSAQENDIILMHDCYASTSEAAFQIIDILQEKGFEFVTVDELLLN